MIDFASTRESADPDTRRAAHLVAAIIVQFLRDAALKPSKQESAEFKNINEDAVAAIEYLFAEGSAFENHIELVGASCAAFRAALLSDRPLPPNSPFTDVQRRIVQLRHRWWKLSRYNSGATP